MFSSPLYSVAGQSVLGCERYYFVDIFILFLLFLQLKQPETQSSNSFQIFGV